MSSRPPRSLILVTGARSADLAAAQASAADIVCVDLEDTVSPADRPAARGLLVQALATAGDRQAVGARIQPLSTAEGLEDLLWLRTLDPAPGWVVLTMAVDPAELRMAARLLPAARRMLIVETAEALCALHAFMPLTDALWLGGKDLSAALGCDRQRGLDAVWGRCVAAAGGRVPVFDDVYRPFDDLPGLRQACAASRERGLHARVSLDARQIGVLQAEVPGAGSPSGPVL